MYMIDLQYFIELSILNFMIWIMLNKFKNQV